MSTASPGDARPAPPAEDARRIHVNEDWLATGVGLLLLVLILVGVIPEGLVP